MIPRPHDLLRLTEPASLYDEIPGWARTALSTTPWVVVRRAGAPAGCVAVGVRGDDRAHRHALTIADAQIGEVTTPEDLAAGHLGVVRDVAALRALATARAFVDECGMPWGPTGSVGFELATGTPTVTNDSDLDVTVRAPALTSAVLQRLEGLHLSLAGMRVRVDCQIELSRGAVALAELVAAPPEVLVKTVHGPAMMSMTELLS